MKIETNHATQPGRLMHVSAIGVVGDIQQERRQPAPRAARVPRITGLGGTKVDSKIVVYGFECVGIPLTAPFEGMVP